MIQKTAGLIGIGAMGLPMARNMVNRGFEVVGFDLNQNALAAAVEVGVQAATDLADLVARVEIIVASLPNDASMRALTKDLAPLMRPNQLLLVTGTHSIELMRELAEIVAPSGGRVVDAPVVWGVIGAEEGTLLSLMGGEATDVKRAMEIALSYGQGAEHMGALGAGQLAKAVNNYLHWVHVATNVEALSLAKKYGIDAERMRDVLMKSPGNNGSLGDLEHYGLTWHEKDMDLLLDMAQTVGLMMPIAGQTDQIMKTITKKDTNELLFAEESTYLGQPVRAMENGLA
jgi:3-hydroxyisobutyrate dehydrogenase-like beta-hydroxyacid dehydrogenase